MKIGFASALFLVCLTLKLTNTIDWSWWLVTAPLWVDFILSVWIGVVIERTARAKKKELEEYHRLYPTKKSRFMQKLDDAMEASKERREAELKQRKSQ